MIRLINPFKLKQEYFWRHAYIRGIFNMAGKFVICYLLQNFDMKYEISVWKSTFSKKSLSEDRVFKSFIFRKET